MKAMTVDQFIEEFNPCRDHDEIRMIAGDKESWTALDVLHLENVKSEDKLWAVLREEFIEPHLLHEFACRCAENALALIESPDQRSIDAIAAKRAWLRGEIGDQELAAARDAARDAAWDAQVNILIEMLEKHQIDEVEE